MPLAYDVGVKARLFGGGMIGLQFAAVKTQLNSKLNNVVSYDLYGPEPTMQFPGIDDLLVRYRERARAAGVDALGIYIPPFAYAEMQILQQAINATGSLDDGKLAAQIIWAKERLIDPVCSMKLVADESSTTRGLSLRSF